MPSKPWRVIRLCIICDLIENIFDFFRFYFWGLVVGCTRKFLWELVFGLFSLLFLEFIVSHISLRHHGCRLVWGSVRYMLSSICVVI